MKTTKLNVTSLESVIFSDASEEPEANEPVSRSWIQVAKVGSFDGHASGPFEFTPDVFDQIIRNFMATENRKIPTDWEHGSEVTGGGIYQHGAPANGWITQLENRGEGGLWALVEWVDPQAVDYIRTGRYKYFSPAVVFDATDPVTGESIGPKLVSGALTNRPFLDGLEPLTARDHMTESFEARTTAATLSLAPSDVHVDAAIGEQPKEEAKMAESTDEGQINKVLARLRAAVKAARPSKMDDALDMDALDMDDGADAASMDDGTDAAAMSDADAMDMDALMDAVDAMAAQCSQASLSAQKASLRAAKSDVERVLSAGLLRDSAKNVAFALRNRDPKTFAALYPVEAVEPAPVAPVPVAAAVLTSRVAPKGKPESTVTMGAKSDNHSERAATLAAKLMSEQPATYGDVMVALTAASRAIRAEDAKAGTR